VTAAADFCDGAAETIVDGRGTAAAVLWSAAGWTLGHTAGMYQRTSNREAE